MKDWTNRRASAEGPNFAADVAALGPDAQWLWDNTAPKLETILCGASREALDSQFPPDRNGLRKITVDAAFGFLSATIVFHIDDDDDEKVVYLAVRPLR